ncbi:glycosyl hydrolase family 28-related protein [Paenibacillus donghaensis]|uniref:Rhamnogalacturonase A/B/Epimerase-like pectate lyase domain-containing protein n=1 Tax=Paenibacillus donghaensis TaxID=414771 RepID=A0A2Z2KM26_9BACL|nr:glycosyl hydrolase family 28-related protein [Paenibacillus donghaensis]ASA25425.1 hypothetical protein B9T62_34655 [Paenibacillus donghaensis]
MAEIELIKGADNGNVADKLSAAYPKINRNFQRANSELAVHGQNITNHEGRILSAQGELDNHEVRITQAKGDIDQHKASGVAHAAEHITYEGAVTGTDNLKQAVDIVKDQLDQAIISGDSGPEAAAARVSVSGETYSTLGDRLNDEYEKHTAQLADIAKVTTAQLSVSIDDYGLVGDGVYDNSVGLQAMCDSEMYVYLPPGTYRYTTTLVLSKDKFILSGASPDTILLFEGAGHAVSVEARATIKNLLIKSKYDGTGSNVYIKHGCNLENIHLYTSAGYGVEFCTTNHVITTHLDSVTIAYNKLGGIYLKSTGISQINDVSLNRLYIAKNGFDADNLSSEATPSSGHAMYIDGGLGIRIRDYVFEYNTGAGLYLDKSTGYTLRGLVVEGGYYEQNKYARTVVNWGGAAWDNISVSGSSFSDPYPLPSNSLTPLYGNTAVIERVPLSPTININGIYDITNNKAEIGYSRVSIKPNETFDFNYYPYSSARVRSDLAECEGFKCLIINPELGGFLEYGDNNYTYINPYLDYLIEIEYKCNKGGVAGQAVFQFNRLGLDSEEQLPNTDGGAKFSASLPESLTFIKKQYVYNSGQMKKGTRRLQMYLNNENGLPAGSYLIVKYVRITPIGGNVILSGATSARPEPIKGFQYFDDTLQKQICGNGTVWKDASGATV